MSSIKHSIIVKTEEKAVHTTVVVLGGSSYQRHQHTFEHICVSCVMSWKTATR